MKKLIAFVLFAALPIFAQIEEPSTKMPGPIGPGGASYPLFNAGTVTLTGSTFDLTTYPNTSASVIRFIGNLSATCVITARPAIGFQYTIINATTGGHDIVFKTAAGTGVTIPANSTALVVSNGTDYVAVSGGGGGGGAGPGPGGTGETLLYTTPHTVTMVATNTTQLNLGAQCTGTLSSCDMTTPPVDGTYRFAYEIVSTVAGTGTCTNTPDIRLYLRYRNPDNDLDYDLITSTRLISNANSMFNITAFSNATGTPAMTNNWVSIPFQFRAKGGTPIAFRLQQNTGSDCTGTRPEFIVRPALTLVEPLPISGSAALARTNTARTSTEPWIGVYTNVHMPNAVGNLIMVGSGCDASGVCTMVTPTEDGTYDFAYEGVLTAAGVGCTGNGGFRINLAYRNPDNDLAYDTVVGTRGIHNAAGITNATAIVATLAPAMAANWVNVPAHFRVKAGTPITVRVSAYGVSDCTTSSQAFTFRFALYGPLGY